jgi:hypothetical protein
MAWYGYAPGTFTGQVWARHFEPGKGWGEPRQLTSGEAGGIPRLAVNARGDAVAAWSHAANSSGLRDEVWAVTFSPDSGWSVPTRMQASRGYIDSMGPTPGIDGSGAAVVGWVQTYGAMATESSASPPNRSVLMARFEPGGGWSPAQPVAEGLSFGYGFSLAMAERGDALLLWSRTPVKDAPRVIGSRWFR